MITCEELDLLYADIRTTSGLNDPLGPRPPANGSYDSYFKSSPTYSPKSTVCNKLIEFCTLLQQYLIQVGYDAEYKPVTGYPSHPVQQIWIYLDRGKHRHWCLDVGRYTLLKYDDQHSDSVQLLMAALHVDMLRYQEYCTHEARRELVRVQCNGCYWGGEYCGLGMERVLDCIHRIDNQ
jgi:hypothetical protein